MIATAYYPVVGQNVIEYNFTDRKPEFKLPDNITKGEFYQLKIDNINTNFYKITVNTKDSVTSRALSMPTFGDLPLDALTSAIAGLSPLSTAVNLALENAEESVGFMAKAYTAIDFAKVLKAVGNPRLNDVKQELNRVQSALKEHLNTLESIAMQIGNLKLKVYTARLQYMRLGGTPASFAYEDAFTTIERLRSLLPALQAEVADSKATYEAFAKANNDVIIGDLAETDKAIRAAFGEFETTISKARNAVNADAVNALLTSILFLENNRDNNFLSMPFQFTGDKAILDITIAPRGDSLLGQTYSTRLTFPLEKKAYAGVGLSFYYSTLKNEAFSFVETADTDSTSHFNAVQEEKAAGEIGLASLFRLGTMAGKAKKVGIHFSLGPGLSISDKVKPRVLYGVGMTLGDVHTLAIDLGGNTGYVDKKSVALDLSRNYSAKPETSVVSVLQTGIFFSLGYLFRF
ncbi:MAG: hypothetical protein ACMVP2_14400 [Imperialibacter sp.]|uniref:hypothetical protein n=1 Tax=Imperialibacter sp. TaxID=2038411 RepID=UPI003A88249D